LIYGVSIAKAIDHSMAFLLNRGNVSVSILKYIAAYREPLRNAEDRRESSSVALCVFSVVLCEIKLRRYSNKGSRSVSILKYIAAYRER